MFNKFFKKSKKIVLTTLISGILATNLSAQDGFQGNITTNDNSPVFNGSIEYKSGNEIIAETTSDENGNYTLELPDLSIDDENSPNTFNLKPNYPNPFNPGTILPVNIAQSGKGTLEIFDILGREINKVSKNFMPGEYDIKLDFDMPNGVYFARFTQNEHAQTKKLLNLGGGNSGVNIHITGTQQNNIGLTRTRDDTDSLIVTTSEDNGIYTEKNVRPVNRPTTMESLDLIVDRIYRNPSFELEEHNLYGATDSTYMVNFSISSPEFDVNEFSINHEQITGPTSPITINDNTVSFTPTDTGNYQYIISATDENEMQDTDTLNATINQTLRGFEGDITSLVVTYNAQYGPFKVFNANIELKDSTNTILANTISDDEGHYILAIPDSVAQGINGNLQITTSMNNGIYIQQNNEINIIVPETNLEELNLEVERIIRPYTVIFDGDTLKENTEDQILDNNSVPPRMDFEKYERKTYHAGTNQFYQIPIEVLDPEHDRLIELASLNQLGSEMTLTHNISNSTVDVTTNGPGKHVFACLPMTDYIGDEVFYAYLDYYSSIGGDNSWLRPRFYFKLITGDAEHHIKTTKIFGSHQDHSSLGYDLPEEGLIVEYYDTQITNTNGLVNLILPTSDDLVRLPDSLRITSPYGSMQDSTGRFYNMKLPLRLTNMHRYVPSMDEIAIIDTQKVMTITEPFSQEYWGPYFGEGLMNNVFTVFGGPNLEGGNAHFNFKKWMAPGGGYADTIFAYIPSVWHAQGQDGAYEFVDSLAGSRLIYYNSILDSIAGPGQESPLKFHQLNNTIEDSLFALSNGIMYNFMTPQGQTFYHTLVDESIDQSFLKSSFVQVPGGPGDWPESIQGFIDTFDHETQHASGKNSHVPHYYEETTAYENLSNGGPVGLQPHELVSTFFFFNYEPARLDWIENPYQTLYASEYDEEITNRTILPKFEQNNSYSNH